MPEPAIGPPSISDVVAALVAADAAIVEAAAPDASVPYGVIHEYH